MIDFFFAMVAASLGGGGQQDAQTTLAAPGPAAVQAPLAQSSGTASVIIGENVTIGSSSVIVGGGLLDGTSTQSASEGGGLLAGTTEQAAPAAPAPDTSQFNMDVVPAGLTADPQTPTGKFTTAAEVKPIMDATRGNWVAVREYDGGDLVYVTHIWGWRCGMHAMAISINDEPLRDWPLPECHMKYTTPSAILEEDGLPFERHALGSVKTIDVQIVYDDLTMDAVRFERGNILIP